MGALLGSLAALSIGLSDLFARRVVRGVSALTAALSVSVVAIAASIFAVGVFGSSLRGDDFLIGAVSGLLLGTGLLTYYRGIARSSATVVAPLVGALSAIIPFVYAIVDGADPSVAAVAGAVVAIAGIVLISAGSGPALHVRAGMQWGLVSGLAYGLGFAVVIETSAGAGAWPAAAQRIGASVLLVGLATRDPGPLLPPVGLRISAVLGGVFAGASTVLYLAGLRANPTAAIITTSMFPAASVAVGRTVFQDPVTRNQAIGLVVALIGIAAVVAA